MTNFYVTAPSSYQGAIYAIGGTPNSYYFLVFTPTGRVYVSEPFTSVVEANIAARQRIDLISKLSKAIATGEQS